MLARYILRGAIVLGVGVIVGTAINAASIVRKGGTITLIKGDGITRWEFEGKDKQ